MKSLGWIALNRHGRPLCRITSEGAARGVATKAARWHPVDVREVFVQDEVEQKPWDEAAFRRQHRDRYGYCDNPGRGY